MSPNTDIAYSPGVLHLFILIYVAAIIKRTRANDKARASTIASIFWQY